MIWKLDQTQSEFRFNGWHGRLDLTTPDRGLQIEAPNAVTLTELLSVFFQRPNQPMLQDCYVRQADVIAVYPPREMRKFHVQLDYRLLDSTSERLLVELWISVQTYLLDNHPVVSIQCPLDTHELEIFSDNAAGVLELSDPLLPISGDVNSVQEPRRIAVVCSSYTNKELSIAWLNHPRDQFDTTWSQANEQQRVEARLFGHFMEKGVIRRARMRCLISSQPLSQPCIQEVYDAFVSSPLPLTA